MDYKIVESDALTGEVIEREATAEEIEFFEARAEKIANREVEKQQQIEARAVILERLGLTEEEAKLLLS